MPHWLRVVQAVALWFRNSLVVVVLVLKVVLHSMSPPRTSVPTKLHFALTFTVKYILSSFV